MSATVIAGHHRLEKPEREGPLGTWFRGTRVPTDLGPASWVLHNTRNGAYPRCDDRDVFPWRRLDGGTSIRDLLFAYAQEYRELALPRIEKMLVAAVIGIRLQRARRRRRANTEAMEVAA